VLLNDLWVPVPHVPDADDEPAPGRTGAGTQARAFHAAPRGSHEHDSIEVNLSAILWPWQT
jgi:hypothetical protein